jgi:hypothetical protein
MSTYTGALTGHRYTRARPLGYEPWQPSPDSATMLDACRQVLARLAAADLVPIGPRSIAYQLEHQHIAGREVLKDADLARVPKAERGRYWSFGQIGDVINRGPRAGDIPWAWVSDGGAAQDKPLTFTDRDHVLDCLIDHVLVDQVMPDVLADQPHRVEVSCEAVDFMRLAARITKPLAVPCYSARGWGGPEPARDAGLRWASDPRPVDILSMGDLDPEGIGIVERNFADAARFAVAHGVVRDPSCGASPSPPTRFETGTCRRGRLSPATATGCTCRSRARSTPSHPTGYEPCSSRRSTNCSTPRWPRRPAAAGRPRCSGSPTRSARCATAPAMTEGPRLHAARWA